MDSILEVISCFLSAKRISSVKMNALKKLKEVQPNKPYNGFAKLKIGYHEIVNFRAVKNKYGKKNEGSNQSILIELQDEVLFLPQYFWQKINNDDITELNSAIGAGEKVYLFFGGRNDDTK